MYSSGGEFFIIIMWWWRDSLSSHLRTWMCFVLSSLSLSLMVKILVILLVWWNDVTKGYVVCVEEKKSYFYTKLPLTDKSFSCTSTPSCVVWLDNQTVVDNKGLLIRWTGDSHQEIELFPPISTQIYSYIYSCELLDIRNHHHNVNLKDF